jgi:outer membrane biosynthesis protein TonB
MKFFKTEDERKGMIGTIVFHLLLLLAFVFLGMSIPLPLPEEEGMIINFGTSESGSGDIQPEDISNKITKPNPVEAQPSKAAQETTEGETEENVKTQTTEEAPNISTKSTKSESESTKAPKEETRESNPKLEYPGKKKTNANSDGNTEGTGDQGSVDGAVNSNNRTGGESGAGTGIQLGSRKVESRPALPTDFAEDGVINVEVKVDRNGKVISARAGVKGTEITNKTQLEQARQIALGYKYSPNPNGPAFQIGIISINFKSN